MTFTRHFTRQSFAKQLFMLLEDIRIEELIKKNGRERNVFFRSGGRCTGNISRRS
ncbi:hypothetical protein ACSE3M_22345 [Bacillus velezensis]